jgi:alkylhydroperoxidase family enzyme
MARIPLLDPDDENLDPAARQALLEWQANARQLSARTTGRTPNIIRAMANHPGLLATFRNFVYGPQARISPAQRELAYLTASVVNNCHY